MTVVQMEKSYKPGEIVRLKGGSFDMTVRFHCTEEAARNAGVSAGVTCDWHSDGGQACTETYAPEQLNSNNGR